MAAAIAEGRAASTDDDDDDEGGGLEQMAELGGTLAEAVADLLDQAGAPEAIEVWEENEMAVRWFLAVLTQWRRSTMAGTPTGLDYDGVEATARMMGLAVTPELFDGLQTMELEYVQVCARIAATRANGA